MAYAAAFIVGILAGATISYFVVKNNFDKATAAMQKIIDSTSKK